MSFLEIQLFIHQENLTNTPKGKSEVFRGVLVVDYGLNSMDIPVSYNQHTWFYNVDAGFCKGILHFLFEAPI